MSTASTDIANAGQAAKAEKAVDLLNVIFDRAVSSGLSFEDFVKTLDIDDSGTRRRKKLKSRFKYKRKKLERENSDGQSLDKIT